MEPIETIEHEETLCVVCGEWTSQVAIFGNPSADGEHLLRLAQGGLRVDGEHTWSHKALGEQVLGPFCSAECVSHFLDYTSGLVDMSARLMSKDAR
jgi:hypothetical protein